VEYGRQNVFFPAVLFYSFTGQYEIAIHWLSSVNIYLRFITKCHQKSTSKYLQTGL